MTDGLASFLATFNPALRELSGFPLAVFCLVLLLTLLFVAGYVCKGSQVWWQLRAVIRGVRSAGLHPDPDEVGKHFNRAPLKHLWLEYRDTLHPLRRTANGTPETRATLPAETYFTRDVLVDARLFDDFARHLPGILTGLGIIGTFAGLLQGLSGFDPSNPTKAVSGLTPLLAGVSHAFIASAVAICCAMAVTFLSRLTLAYLYGLVEKLNHAIDSLYNTGAGEEYLARLVHASEKSEAHAAQLKDAMVEDLSRMMTNLVERQIEAQAKASTMLGEHIGETINRTLAAPLQRMTDAMEQTSRGNGEAVSSMLESMLAGFMAKLEDTFGGQMRGASEQIERSLGAMQAVQNSMQQLLGDISRTNEHASTQVTRRLEEALTNASANQELMTAQMRDFVNEFRQLVADEHSKSRRVMDDTVGQVMERVNETLQSLADSRSRSALQEQQRNESLGRRTEEIITGLSGHQEMMAAQMRQFAVDLGVDAAKQQEANSQTMSDVVGRVLEEISASVAQLQATRDAAATQEQARNEALALHTEEVVANLSAQLKVMIEAVTGLSARTQANIDALQTVSIRAIDGMNNGAATMSSAANRFETAGASVANVFEKSAAVASDLQRATSVLQSASATVTQAFQQYDRTRETVQEYVGILKGLVESAGKEAGLTQSMLTDLERIVQTLREAERQATEYLNGVNETLTESFEQFGNAMTNQLRQTIGETDRHLGHGVQQLTGVVQELGIALQRMKRAA
ncbi:anti-phage defense ZorAB system protein ZorA [Paraburkholderia edwinii]|uniref:Anti-phage defense ZorAB system protein ZorA n=1 Tax=Paraburkholderia edwinii TaxID=2861782 RepID=A0ABX8UJ76_9BURK|nr:anti-phage ZorAB system protein ZorA [Paraburkholderia edwinii]QYD69029.1 anti-phage defense ZorAB system protein ZorA [Paraburkholderia edwinii]